MRLPNDPEQLAELVARLALWRVKGVGPQLFKRLIKHYGQAQWLLAKSSQQLTTLAPALVTALMQPDWYGAKRDLAWLALPTHYLLWDQTLAFTACDSIPEALARIAQAPPLLFVRGDPTCLGLNQIAMVGSRKPTAYGLSIGYELASQLAAVNIVITSGLALGIDSQCQRGALAVGGKSIGVLAVGLDQVYPKCHSHLAEQVIETGGAIVSEFPLGTPPLPHHFPRRNRLISGLSAAVIVVEAALPSGSLITAHYGADQGREVFAIPGSIRHRHFRGCHALIKEGAHLLESIADIYAILPDLFSEAPLGLIMKPMPVVSALNGLEQQLLRVLEEVPLALDDIQMRMPERTEVLNALLTTLVLKGYLKQNELGFYLKS